MKATKLQESLKEQDLKLKAVERKNTQLEQRMSAKLHDNSHQPLAQTSRYEHVFEAVYVGGEGIGVSARDWVQGMLRLLLRQPKALTFVI